MKTATAVKYVIGGIIAVGAFIVLIFLGFTLMYPGSFVIPDRSEYPHGIVIHANPEDTHYFPFLSNRPKDSYTAVTWDRFGNNSEHQYPMTFTIEDKTWKPADLQYESFLKSGAVDNRVQYAKEFGKPVDLSTPPIATLTTKDSKATIVCEYNQGNELTKVYLRIRHSVVQGKSTGPQKTAKITLPEGEVTLPADHSSLVKHLGKPLHHTPARTAYSSNVL